MKRLSLFLVLMFPIYLMAQSNFKMGYVLNNANDTLKGYVYYTGKQINPEYVEFKTEKKGESRRLPLSECAGFGVDNGPSYQRDVVNISMNSINLNTLIEVRDTSRKSEQVNAYRRDSVLLLVLQRGPNISLFSYTDKLKTRFYIQNREESEPVELILNLYSDLGTIVTKRTYLRQLLVQMQKYIPDLSMADANINGARYAEGDILEIVSKINNQPYTNRVVKSISFFMGAGLNQTRASYSGSHPLAGPTAVSKTFAVPMIVLGFDVPSNPEVGRLMYRFDLSGFMSKNEVSTEPGAQSSTSTTHSFNQTNISLTPQLFYNFYNSKNLKVYLGGGPVVGVSIYDKNISTIKHKSGQFPDEIEEDPVDLNAFHLSLKLTGGVLINKRVELSAGYYPKSAISSYSGFRVSVQRFAAGIHYHFGKN